MDIISRLKEFLDSYKISNSEFADNCGIPRPTVSQLLNGRNKKISDEIITKIHQTYPALSMLWLLFGEGSMMSNSNIENITAQKSGNIVPQSSYTPVNQQNNNRNPSINPVQASGAEKVPDDIFTYFASQEDEKSVNTPENNMEMPSKENILKDDNASSVNVPADPHKRITNIVVFYNDNSFQSFQPVRNQ